MIILQLWSHKSQSYFQSYAIQLSSLWLCDFVTVQDGNCKNSKGYFVEPTVILTADVYYTIMEEKIFDPVSTSCVYDNKKYDETLKLW